MASPDSSGRRPWGQLIATSDGKYVQLYEDGSATIYDQQFNVVSDDTSPNPQRAAMIQAGKDRDAVNDAVYSAASNENTRRFNEGQQRTKEANATTAQSVKNQYTVAMRNAKSEEERNAITKWYNEQQVELAKAKLGQEQEATLASLHGPADYVQAANYARGMANRGGATFLSSLQNNSRQRDYGGQQGTPEAESLDTLTSKLTGSYSAGSGGSTNVSGAASTSGDSTGTAATQTATGTTGTTAAATTDNTGGNTYSQNADDLKARAGAIYARGAHKIAGGGLESLTPTELSLLQSGVDAAGGDWSTFLSTYGRSRVGQGIGWSKAA